MLDFDRADMLCGMICDFLVSCGGPYKEVTGDMQRKILVCIASRQFIIKIRDGKIRYFACWLKVKPENIEMVKERVLPYDVFTGSIMYVAEAANRDGKRGMAEMVRRIRAAGKGMQGVFWHRPSKEDTVYHFPSQKGKEA